MTEGRSAAASASAQHSAVSTASAGRSTWSRGHGAQGGQVLDRLVGRAVFAQADRVVSHDEDNPKTHQGREADRRATIVGEDQEGAAIGNDAAVQGHAVHGRGHAVLAHPVMNVAAGIVPGLDDLVAGRLGVVRAGQIGRSADQLGNPLAQDVEDLVARGDPGGQIGGLGG